MLRQLARHLAASRPAPKRSRDAASVVAVFASGEDDACSLAMVLFRQAFLAPGDTVVLDARVGADQLTGMVEQAERRGRKVLLLAGVPGTSWSATCGQQADRAVVIVGDVPAIGEPVRSSLPRGADVALAGAPVTPPRPLSWRRSRRAHLSASGRERMEPATRQLSHAEFWDVLSGSSCQEAVLEPLPTSA